MKANDKLKNPIPTLTNRRRLRLLTLSAKDPAIIPRNRKGTIRRARDTPTMKDESVISKITHPTITCSPMNPTELNALDNQRNLKSLNVKDGETSRLITYNLPIAKPN